jgi:dual specificity phosphatase 12
MGYKIDPSYKSYKIFRLKLAAEQVKSCRILPSEFMNLLSPDPALMQERPEPHVYRCRKCRRIVASKSNLITHKPENHENFTLNAIQYNSHSSPRKLLENSHNEQAGNSTNNDVIEELADKMVTSTLSNKSLTRDQEVCNQTYFVEPISWMKDVINSVEGKLYCPSCKTKIGSFNWLMASKCPCGKQVSPSFYLVPSKIDYSNVVQNIKQVTV